MHNTETITALCTSFGNAGIHIIRISGDKAFYVIGKIFKKGKSQKTFDVNKYDSHTIHYGYIFDGNKCIDEVMVSIYKAPNSYTKEDVIEINCHGGSFVARNIIMLITKFDVRMAEPGEFSKRAFLNGRIDLSQAEAIMDVIKSQNDYALKSSVGHLRGDIKTSIENIRENILNEMAFIEASLDDPEHYELKDYGNILYEKIMPEIGKLEKLSKSYKEGRIISEGINTVIIGKPNVGKSSFLNYLLNENKAIVTDIPGTTRDIIEYSINIGNMCVNLIDTAGIHKTEDYIEKIGIEKTLESINKAQLIICIFDMSREFDEEDEYVLSQIKGRNSIVLLNKSDKKRNIDLNRLKDNNIDYIAFSTKTGEGFDLFTDKLENMFYSDIIDVENEIFITNVRQAEAINNAVQSLKLVIDNILNKMPEDLLIIDMMDAYNSLGEITGDTVGEQLIDKIFAEFCMGK